MSILYTMRAVNDNINENPKQGLRAMPVSRGTRTLEDIAGDIAEEITFNRAEIRAVLDILIMQIEKNLKNGYQVRLGDLGTFFVSTESRMVENEKEIRADSVKLKRITYKASREFTERVRGARFEKGISPKYYVAKKK